MKLVELSTKRPVTIMIFAIAGVVFGFVSLQQLATDLLPDITYPSLTVQTSYDGAAPIEVESLITRPVENGVGVVNGVVRVTSSSRPDISEVTLEFAWGTNMDLAGLDVRERLDLLRLPVAADRPLLLRYDPSLDPILRVGVSGTGGDSDLVYLRRVAEDELKRALERIDGVAAVVVSGGLEEEIHVELDERRLSNLGLSVNQVTNRLAQENVNLTGGRLREGQTEFLVRTVNEFQRAADMSSIVVANNAGAIVQLQDVATVSRGHKEREVITRIDGQESVEVAIFKEGGTNTVTVSETVQVELESLKERLQKLDPNLRVSLITDQARYIRQSVQQVFQTALFGGLLAIMVLYFFLRSWKTTSIIGIAIPISVITTFFLMYASGISLNIMSLGGLTLGIGLLVDNSIVVLEAIQRRRDKGMNDLEAAHAGASEVGRAVIASTLTTICVFVPIVFVEGVAGQLFGDQALTVTFSLIVSLVVALTVIPMLAGSGLKSKQPLEEPGEDTRWAPFRWASAAAYAIALGIGKVIHGIVQGLATVVHLILALPLKGFAALLAGLTAFYERLLAWVLRHAFLTVVASLLLLAGSLTLYPKLGNELIPELVQGEFFVDAELPPGTRLEVTERQLRRVEANTAAMDGVEMVYAIAGASNDQGGVAGSTRENLGQLTIRVAQPATREKEEALMASIRQQLDGFESLDYRFGRPAYFSFKTPIEVEIRGYNLQLLKRLGDQLVEQMQAVEGLTDVKSSTEGGSPELQIRFNRDRLATYELTVAQIGGLVRDKVQGIVATDIQREDRTIDIRLRAEEAYRDSVPDLLQLTVHQVGKTSIPLSAVADVVEVEGPAEIRRAEGDRVAVITANLIGRDLGAVSADISDILSSMNMPSGFDWRIGGQRQEMETSFNSMRMAILLAVFMVYLVMASQFESFIHPLVILFSVPFSIIGVLLTLYLFDVRISIVVLIGVILLAGIVVNNAIILVDYTNRQRRKGLSKIEALQRAGRVRLRPILMTTATTVLGLAPMALGLGEGSELRTPMALTVIGGLIASTALTLLIIPAVYSLIDRRA